MNKKTRTEESGYRDCACRDCFEIAIGAKGAMCHDCVTHECDHHGESECESPSAYGCGDNEAVQS